MLQIYVINSTARPCITGDKFEARCLVPSHGNHGPVDKPATSHLLPFVNTPFPVKSQLVPYYNLMTATRDAGTSVGQGGRKNLRAI